MKFLKNVCTFRLGFNLLDKLIQVKNKTNTIETRGVISEQNSYFTLFVNPEIVPNFIETDNKCCIFF